MRISDWSSDVCSSDLRPQAGAHLLPHAHDQDPVPRYRPGLLRTTVPPAPHPLPREKGRHPRLQAHPKPRNINPVDPCSSRAEGEAIQGKRRGDLLRSEEHTSELQSLMRISYAVFCLKKKKRTKPKTA